MIKALVVVGLVAGAAYMVDFKVSPQARKEVLAAGRTVTGFVGKNVKVTDEYLRCKELNPLQPEVCDKNLKRDFRLANGLNSTDGGVHGK